MGHMLLRGGQQGVRCVRGGQHEVGCVRGGRVFDIPAGRSSSSLLMNVAFTSVIL